MPCKLLAHSCFTVARMHCGCLPRCMQAVMAAEGERALALFKAGQWGAGLAADAVRWGEVIQVCGSCGVGAWCRSWGLGSFQMAGWLMLLGCLQNQEYLPAAASIEHAGCAVPCRRCGSAASRRGSCWRCGGGTWPRCGPSTASARTSTWRCDLSWPHLFMWFDIIVILHVQLPLGQRRTAPVPPHSNRQCIAMPAAPLPGRPWRSCSRARAPSCRRSTTP